jgi:3D-(3,5/4)-trihydroxycyclohexane-1,2-dione acylhydrolase (decyclizing)
VVIVAQVEQHRYLTGSGAFWDVGVPLTSQRPGSQKGTAQHLEGRARQRYYGATTVPSKS